VAAGKYNDGAPANRPILAGRLATGMSAAWNATQRTPITGSDVGWPRRRSKVSSEPAAGGRNSAGGLLDNASAKPSDRVRAAADLVWARRTKAGQPIQMTCLRLGPNCVLTHMPGELFVEYELAAAAMKPQATVCMAPTATTGPAISAPRSPTRRGATKPPTSRASRRRLKR